MGKLVDNIIAFKLLKMLITPFDKTDAYKLGIVDENGKVLRKARTLTKSSEHDAYNYLTRLVFSVKRILNKFGGENKLKSFAAALYLIKEHENLSKDNILLEEYEELDESLEDSFAILMEDEGTLLNIEIVEKFLNEEMVTISAIPKEDGGETTPVVKKPLKLLKRRIEDDLGDKK